MSFKKEELPVELDRLAERMGRDAFERRFQMQRRMVDAAGRGFSKGVFKFENMFNLYKWVRIGLKVSGLWNRAVRNYLDVQVVENVLHCRDLPKAMEGYTILQLTDLHADLHPDFPAAVKRVIAGLEYDLLVVTGDFRTCVYGCHHSATDAAIQILSDVEKPIYAVLGNHDFIEKVPKLEAAGIRFLLNESVQIQAGEVSFYLSGIDDSGYYKTHDIERAMTGVERGAFSVLLSHVPNTAQAAQAYGVDCILSGHTHGGQICPPGGRVLVHDGSSPRKCLSGPWADGSVQGYTSRGTGASCLPVRLNCPAEVTLHRFYRG